jgi:imidazolonepropionase-like amidohydrolase
MRIEVMMGRIDQAARLCRRLAAAGLLASSGVALALPPAPAPAQTQAIALVGGQLHLGNGEVIADGTLVFADGRISAVGARADVAIPAGAQRVEITGQRVYPGLVLLDADLGLVEVEAVRATVDTTELGELNPEVQAASAYNVDSELIPATRFNGVLTAQTTPQGGVISGRSAAMQLDAWTGEDALLRADDGLWLNWPPVRAPQFDFATFTVKIADNPAYAQQMADLEGLFADARAHLAAGATVRNLKLEALRDVLEGNSRLYVRTESAADFERALAFADRHGIRQLAWFGAAEAATLIPLLVAREIPVVIAGLHRLPQYNDSAFDEPYRLAARLHQAGVRVAITYPGTMNARNLPFLAGTAIAYGVPAEDALAMITRVPAELLGLGEELGTLAVGKRATLFVSRGDALDMRGNDLQQAYIDGRQIDLIGRQQQLYERYRARYE